jgi:hypothetical protein
MGYIELCIFPWYVFFADMSIRNTRKVRMVMQHETSALATSVLRKIQRYWPDENPQVILDILNAYGTAEMERGRTRVHLAILKLSDGQKERLPELVAMAKRDYRDVIAYAEYPEQMKMGFIKMRQLSTNERKALKKRDVKQYADWMKNG